MESSRILYVVAVILFVTVIGLVRAGDNDEEVAGVVNEQETEAPVLNDEEIEYHKGSLCGYCTYCKVEQALLCYLSLLIQDFSGVYQSSWFHLILISLSFTLISFTPIFMFSCYLRM